MFDPGDRVTINTGFAPTAGCNIVTDTYEADMSLYLKFGMGVDFSTHLCVFDCTDLTLIDIDLPVREYDMIKISSVTGIDLLDGIYHWGVDEAFPFHYEDPEGVITVDVDLPSNAGANVYLNGKVLHSFANPTDPYFNTYFSIPKFIGILQIPYVSAFFANLSNSYEAGPFYINYTIMEAGFNLGLYNKQHLIFNPSITGTFNLQTEVDYQVVNPSNGQVISQGHGSQIDYTVGNNVKIDFPCNYEFIDVVPSFDIYNSFRNHTYDSIALDFVFDMLEFHMGMEDITVIPAFCIDIPYPCPTWSNPFKWCTEEVCTPDLNFNGFDIGFGPLVHWQPNLFNIKYDWLDDTWEMDGFTSLDNLTPFQLVPREFIAEMSVNQVLCSGQNTGSATVTVTNGSPPYTYEWSNGVVVVSNSTSNTQTGLEAGTHYVIVRDAGNCSKFATEVIVQPDEPLSVAHNVDNPNCFDSFDGSITVAVSGGTPNYTYNWSSGETTPNITNLDAGNYTLTLTDDNGCQVVETYNLTKPDAISSGVTFQNVNCKGDNSGFISLDVEGGVAPYSYLWSTGNTTSSAYDLPAGTYDVLITDFNNCTRNESIEILEPSQILSVSESITDASCFGDSTGLIDVTPSGGTSPYFYTWYNADFNVINQSVSQLSNVPAGDYTLLLKDSLNCTDTLTYTINQPDDLNYDFDIQNVLCNGMPEGQILLNISGATPPYSYFWSNGGTTNPLINLFAGDYSVTIIDDNNCEYVLNATVSQPFEALMVSTEVDDVKCFGDSTGSILAVPSGGTSPYTYLWSDGSTNEELINVPIGSYTVTTTDANNCVYYTGGTVTQPDNALTVNFQTFPVSCFGYSDGSINIELLGGTLPYSYIWDDDTYQFSTNQQVIDELKTGVYNVIVVDGNNCTNIETFFIDSPDSVIISLSPTIVSCYNGNNGTITPAVIGGTEPYSYFWSNGTTNSDLTNVQAGFYLLTVTDNNDCIYTASTEISSYPEIVVSSEVIPPTCKDIDDASILLEIIGGTKNYYFVWSNGETSQDIYELAAGNYNVVVHDENNCEVLVDFEVPYTYTECLSIPSTFSPNGDGINDLWVLTGIDAYSDASVQVFNVWGNLVYQTNNIYIPWNGNYNGKPMPSGTYYYIVDLKNGDEVSTGTVTIVR